MNDEPVHTAYKLQQPTEIVANLPPPKSTIGNDCDIRYFKQVDKAWGVKLKEAIGSPDIPSAPHWQTMA